MRHVTVEADIDLMDYEDEFIEVLEEKGYTIIPPDSGRKDDIARKFQDCLLREDRDLLTQVAREFVTDKGLLA